jgi:RNA polymerase sigma-70 factor (ECF subfamily)
MSFDPEFEKLVKLYYRDLYRFGLSLTASEADAADLTQETFYIWANKGHQLKNPVKVKAWLFTTLHRQFLQTRRHQMRFQSEPIDEASADFTHVPADCVERIDAQTLLSFLGQLDENHRAPLVLYYLEDLSYNEIAETLAVPLGTVQSRIARAKIKLLQLLNETAKPPLKDDQ